MKFGKTNTNPSVDSGKSQSVTIGDITISPFSDGVLWMESESAGDAMSVSEEKLAAALEHFYNNNF
ncbi:hypothetical protein [Serratia liquefaciens]|uniref:hypothetical protein n=1 Tax=Serratia liquefaciens TaxID=614 RepID=UPI0003584E9D|nr:hypothetical protein [Serratia liquefaciens]AGQ30544.1 hypothetical protein M495_08815 [Serratia liquefaciens ATCC 27592]CAI0882885.1 Uncharacterised protein [Serratia liquefaciens]